MHCNTSIICAYRVTPLGIHLQFFFRYFWEYIYEIRFEYFVCFICLGSLSEEGLLLYLNALQTLLPLLPVTECNRRADINSDSEDEEEMTVQPPAAQVHTQYLLSISLHKRKQSKRGIQFWAKTGGYNRVSFTKGWQLDFCALHNGGMCTEVGHQAAD